jgi:catechol 2,3-dioxygenase-like lactoylglutathione lyase family enzyme
VDMQLEVIVLPVTDVDRAKQFYAALGWREDADVAGAGGVRVVQLTPPGSRCSVQFGTGLTTAEPGSFQGTYLVVEDLEKARAELTERGATVSETYHEASIGDRFQPAGGAGRLPGAHPEHGTYGSFASFSDPDGNGWLLQEITTRLPGRD